MLDLFGHATVAAAAAVAPIAPGSLTGAESSRGASSGIESLVPASRLAEAGLAGHHTFDRYLEGVSNRMALSAARGVAAAPGKTVNPLMIHGPCGVGKTHLLQSIGCAILAQDPSQRVACVAAEKFMNELVACIARHQMGAFRAKYRSLDVLLIDDIQFMQGKGLLQEEFFHTFNALYQERKQIVLVSDKLPRDIPGLEDRLRSRFDWGIIVEIGRPDPELALKILAGRLKELGVECDDDAMAVIAGSGRADPRSLQGISLTLKAMSTHGGGRVTAEMARQVCARFRISRPAVSIPAVQQAAAFCSGLSVRDLASAKRTRNVVEARQIAMYLCRQHTRASLAEIASAFGGKDHSTVLHACGRVRDMLADDVDLAARVQAVEGRLLG